MTPEAVFDVLREATWLTIRVSAPMMIVALVVGLTVSLLQALTQLQEMTLSFVPKIVAILITFVIASPFMLAATRDFTVRLFAMIAGDVSLIDGGI